jgi:hypothetical protein
MRKRRLSFLLVAVFLLAIIPPAWAQKDRLFSVGWYVDAKEKGKLARFAKEGCSIVLASGAAWFVPSQLSIIKAFLDEAQTQRLKVIVSFVMGPGCPYPMPGTDFVNAINTLKTHPALLAWYLADEPELYVGAHAYLSTNPGYYKLCKAADPIHPVYIVQTRPPRIEYLDVEDVVGVDMYPGCNYSGVDAPEFNSKVRESYSVWGDGLKFVADHSKIRFVAVVQGFGVNQFDSKYRDLTLEEHRYHVFTAVVQGVKEILFWYDGWANPNMKANVAKIIGQIQSIGAEMRNGITKHPRVKISETSDRLIYRYGVKGKSHVILAVNIANRSSSKGAPLSNVRFTLPQGVMATQVEVLGENRTLPVVDGVFADNFKRFEVHAYRFFTLTTSSQVPTALKIVENR